MKRISKQIVKEDLYTATILREEYTRFLQTYKGRRLTIEKTGLPLRHQNPPEDITENIVKFIIHNYEGDKTCKWGKSIGVAGDLISDMYVKPIEVKAFTSDGPSSFGPNKKFAVIYFLDMRKWLEDTFTLWKINVNDESGAWQQVKMNKTQTNEEQCLEKRRPHISWDRLYPQLQDHTTKIYEGSFENIFKDENEDEIMTLKSLSID